MSVQDPALLALVREARALYDAYAGKDGVISPAAPVLFFGDLPSYRESGLRVATTALNPSLREFEARFRRFPGADSPDDGVYLRSLVGYFRAEPYRSWFDFYEQALLGMGASYYGSADSTALHTDIASVLPTNPTWSGLDRSTQERLARDGVQMWHRLIDIIEPHIVLVSVARKWLKRIEFPPLTDWKTLRTFEETKSGKPRKRPVAVEACWRQLSSGEPFLLAYAPALEKPLASLGHEQKREAGRIIRERWSRGVW